MILLIRKFAFLITSLSLFLSLFLVPSMGLFNPVYLEPPAPCSVSASWCRVLCSCDVERPSKVRQLISQTIQFKILVCVRYIGFPIKILKFNIFNLEKQAAFGTLGSKPSTSWSNQEVTLTNYQSLFYFTRFFVFSFFCVLFVTIKTFKIELN